MIPFKFNGEKVHIPSSWNDFTVGMMQRALVESSDNPDLWKDPLYRIATYTAVPYSLFQNSSMSDEAFELLMNALAFEKQPLDVKAMCETVPNVIHIYNLDGTINTESHRIPKLIDQEYVGQKVMFMQDVAPKVYTDEGEKSIVPVIDLALAIYFQPKLNPGQDPLRPFDTGKVMELRDQMKMCKFSEALPVATFFLIKFCRLTKKKQSSSPEFLKTESLKQE